MEEKNKQIGEKLFKKVKAKLTQAKKHNKEKGLTSVSYGLGRASQQADIEVWDNTIWKDGHKVVKSYIIKVEQEKFAEVRTHYDVREVFAELANLLNEQKKVKGWSGLNFMREQVSLESGSWSGYEVSIIPKICLADAPCGEYKSLMNYINKYGIIEGTWGTKMNLSNYELFCAQMGGKRGRLWDEYGERLFLDNKPKKCTKILEELRKMRGSKDKMLCKRGEENYIDPIDQRYSEMHEIECEGEKRKYLLITIKTPMGKVKYQQKIY